MVGGFRRALLMGAARKKSITPSYEESVVYFDVTVHKDQTRVFLLNEKFIDVNSQNPADGTVSLVALQNNDEEWEILYDVKADNGFYTFQIPEGQDEHTFHLCMYPRTHVLPNMGSIYADPFEDYDPYNPPAEAKSGISVIDLRQSTITLVAGKNLFESRGCFEGNTFLKEAYLGNNVTIGDQAFFFCTSLTTLGESKLGHVGVRAFERCLKLPSVTISGSAPKVDNLAFYDCLNLSSITLESGSTTLSLGRVWCGWNGDPELRGTPKDKTLYWNRKKLSYSNKISDDVSPLKTVVIGGMVEEIPASMFSNSEVSSVTLANSVKKINNMAFMGTKISSITIPSSCTYIGKSVFNSCSLLTSVTAHNGITFIGDQAFTATSWWMGYSRGYRTLNNWLLGYCGSLQYGDAPYTIPSNVTRIAEYALKDQVWLSEEGISASSNIDYLGDAAFEGCIRFDARFLLGKLRISTIPTKAFARTATWTLREIYSGVTTIGSSAFEGCNQLIDIKLPESLINIGTNAFSGCVKVGIIEAYCTKAPYAANSFGNNSSTWVGSSSDFESNRFECYNTSLRKQDFIDSYWAEIFDPNQCNFEFIQAGATTTPSPN